MCCEGQTIVALLRKHSMTYREIQMAVTPKLGGALEVGLRGLDPVWFRGATRILTFATFEMPHVFFVVSSRVYAISCTGGGRDGFKKLRGSVPRIVVVTYRIVAA